MRSLPLRNLAVLCLLAGCPSLLWAAAKELTTSEKVAIVKNPRGDGEDRVKYINDLGELSDSQPVRDSHAADVMLDVANDKKDDLFVRIAAVQALGKYQHNTVVSTKAKYVFPFTAMLKDANELALVRKAIAEVFKATLDPSLPQDKDAYHAELDVVKNKTEVPGLRATCIQGVGAFPSPESIDILTGCLVEKDALIREAAAQAISDLIDGLPDTDLSLPTVNKLVEMLNDKTLPSDLKVSVMRVLAKLIRNENMTAKSAMPVILQVVAKSNDNKMVKGGIEALGIVGSAEAVPPLIAAYNDFNKAKAAPKADAPDAAAPADKEKTDKPEKGAGTPEVEIRKAIMKAMRSILAVQATRSKGPEIKAVHDVAALLIKVVDDDSSTEVKISAVYAMQYLYPKKFENEQKEALDALIFLLKEPKIDDTLKAAIVSALDAISGGRGYKEDVGRWEEYFDKRYGGKRAEKVAGQPK